MASEVGRAGPGNKRPEPAERSSTEEDWFGGLVDEPDIGHPTHGNDIVAVGEPPDRAGVSFAVAKDGACGSPIQGRDGRVRLIDQQMGPGFGPDLRMSDKDIV